MTANNNHSNVPAYLTEGRKAGKELNSMSKSEGKAEAYAVHALVTGWHEFDWSYTVERKGDEKDQYSSTLAELATDPRNENGSVDAKRKTARFAGLMSQFFDIQDAKASQIAVVNRALLSARYIVEKNAPCELKGDTIAINRASVVKLAADASDSDKAVYEAAKDVMVTLNGKGGLSLSELRKRASETFPSKNGRKAKTTAAAPEVTFKQSLAFVHGIMLQQVDPKADETAVAMSPELRKTLYDLQVTLAAYFTADPIDVKAEEKKSANAG